MKPATPATVVLRYFDDEWEDVIAELCNGYVDGSLFTTALSIKPQQIDFTVVKEWDKVEDFNVKVVKELLEKDYQKYVQANLLKYDSRVYGEL